MRDNDIVTIPLVVHENELSRADRIIHALIAVIVVMAVIIFTLNIVWFNAYHEIKVDSALPTIQEAKYLPHEERSLWTKDEKTKRDFYVKFAQKANTKNICPI